MYHNQWANFTSGSEIQISEISSQFQGNDEKPEESSFYDKYCVLYRNSWELWRSSLKAQNFIHHAHIFRDTDFD